MPIDTKSKRKRLRSASTACWNAAFLPEIVAWSKFDAPMMSPSMTKSILNASAPFAQRQPNNNSRLEAASTKS